MLVDVTGILKQDGLSRELDFSDRLEGLDDISMGYEFGSPVKFKGIITNHKGELKLDGMLETTYKAACGRCLSDMDIAMSLKVKESIFRDSGKKSDEVYTYDGNTVDVGRILKDNIILSLPVRHICSENCKGLCGGCGVNLNTSECSCGEKPIDPRLEALKKFRQ